MNITPTPNESAHKGHDITSRSSGESSRISPNSGVQDHMKAVDAVSGGANQVNNVLFGMEGGEISEKERSNVSENKGGSFTSKSQNQANITQDEATVRARLNQQVAQTNIKIMARKVKTAIVQEIKTTKKEVKNFKRNVTKYAYELAEAFGKLRHLRELLRNIGEYALEVLRMLFEKVCKKESLATVSI